MCDELGYAKERSWTHYVWIASFSLATRLSRLLDGGLLLNHKFQKVPLESSIHEKISKLVANARLSVTWDETGCILLVMTASVP